MSNIKIFDKYRPLSWSSLSSFKYDSEKWYDKYVLGIKEPSNATMDFGKYIGDKLSSDPAFLPEVPRYTVFEKELRARIGDLYLIGYLDSFCSRTKSIHEYKTSANDKRWTQESANDHGQLLFYLFLIWKNYGVPPEEVKCHLHYIPVEEKGDFTLKLSSAPVQSFEVRHTALDVLKFGGYIQKTHESMLKYVEKRHKTA